MSEVHKAARGVIFDMDGTLIEPAIDFRAMREAIGIPSGDVLEVIESWEDEERAARAHAVIEAFEARAAARLVLMPGTRELLDWLGDSVLERAIVTRNNRATLDLALPLFDSDFSMLIDRSFLPPKPAPHALLSIAESWAMEPHEIWMVGDSRHDLRAARAAGMSCCLVEQPYNIAYRHEADVVIGRLDELIAHLVT